ncbi:hypothetical protein ANN_03140 [Periplaneta americana]|uniref:DUF4817 domain-containing protein n=1 Tax=Periplaneta americana TaxID=6978 RepID=A0ABQ8U236_PERAM|nr:hypothetical protein ANN_26227 [Periplaneta americana]KAJ4451670.1 hypothetical protein ANN_03140 [Periplaneta americana]
MWYSETNSPIMVQRNFRRTYPELEQPDVKTMKAWLDKLLDSPARARNARLRNCERDQSGLRYKSDKVNS